MFLSWEPDDQDKALAWLAAQSEHCTSCGTRAAEWDPKQGGHRHAYVAKVDRCPGCEAVQQAQRELSKTASEELGLRIGLERNPELED